MAEMENDVTLDEELDEDNFESEDNDNDTSYSELTEEDYYKEVERRKKAEETLVKLKRQAKQQDTSGDVVTKTDLAIDRFILKNPEYEGTEKDLRKYMSKGLSLDEAKRLVEPDKTDENKNKMKRTSITAGESGGSQTTYTMAELEKMSQSEYERVREKIDKGEVIVK